MGERLGLHNKNPKENSSQILIMETRYHNCHLWLWRNSFPSNIQVTEGGQGLNSCFDHKQHSSNERECPGSAPISRSYSELNLIKIIGLTNTHTHLHTIPPNTHAPTHVFIFLQNLLSFLLLQLIFPFNIIENRKVWIFALGLLKYVFMHKDFVYTFIQFP